MAKVYNPIYDTIFKHLMTDKKAAKVLLGNLLQKNIIDLTLKNNEYTGALSGCKEEAILVGIGYTRRKPKGDEASGNNGEQQAIPGKYTCRIEKASLEGDT